MIEVKRDDNGKVIAFIEWNLLDEYGRFDDGGEQVWVQEVWIYPDSRNQRILERFIIDIARKAQTAQYARFRRRFIKDGKELFTPLKKYTREELIKYAFNKEGNKEEQNEEVTV